jgi:hypothetical protein
MILSKDDWVVVDEQGLLDVWSDLEYIAYRKRVHPSGCAPCTFCGDCEMSEQNLVECIGNIFPSCGGYLWA